MRKAVECGGDAARENRELFIQNLGWLLSQTRAGVDHIEYDDGDESGYEAAIVQFTDGFRRRVSIEWDSFVEIIKDVIKNVR